MSEKKLSFGFKNKIVKKTNVISTKPTESQISVQLIDYLEDQTINIKGAVIQEKKPLTIPIQSDDKNLIERVIAAKKLKERSNKSADEILNNIPDSELSLDELAARQLIREAKSNLPATSSKNGSIRVFVVPAVEDTLILEGSKEPTLDDYENVPVGDFGFAMLRGMGWSEKTGIGKGNMSISVAKPEVRPKGMGLGAFKMVQEEVPKQIAVDKDGKELNLIKGAFAKVIAGKEKGFYCKVEGLDDEAGRVIVKMAIKGTILSLNEFMLYPVNQEEYSTSSRILNNSKYRDYQEKEAISSGQASSNNKSSTSTSQDPHVTKIIKTEIKKKEHEVAIINKRSEIIIKDEIVDKEKKSRRSRSYERSSSDCYEANRKNIKGRSRSRSFDRKEHIKYDRNKKESDFSKDYRRSYKSRSRSPSYHRKDKKESRHASKYRSRSKSIEYYDKKQKSSKKNQNRRSKSSSLDSPLSSKNKHSKCHRSNSPHKDKDKSTSRRWKDSSNSSDETKSFKSKHNYKDCSNKTKTSTYDLEKNRKYSESESEMNDASQKRDIDKSAKKYYKDKKSKSSKKYDNDSSSDDGEKRSYSRKKKTYSSHYKSSDV